MSKGNMDMLCAFTAESYPVPLGSHYIFYPVSKVFWGPGYKTLGSALLNLFCFSNTENETFFYFRYNSTKLEQLKLSLMVAFEMNKP